MNSRQDHSTQSHPQDLFGFVVKRISRKLVAAPIHRWVITLILLLIVTLTLQPLNAHERSYPETCFHKDATTHRYNITDYPAPSIKESFFNSSNVAGLVSTRPVRLKSHFPRVSF